MPDHGDTDIQRPLMAMLGHGPSSDLHPRASRAPARRSRAASARAGRSVAGELSVLLALVAGGAVFAGYAFTDYLDETTIGGLALGSSADVFFSCLVLAGLGALAAGAAIGLAGLLRRGASTILSMAGIAANVAAAAIILHLIGAIQLPDPVVAQLDPLWTFLGT